MAYTPENNPYIPGDPYSYDLKWQVDHINMLQGRVDDLDNAIQEATDQADRSEREADRAAQQANMSENFSDYSYRQGLKSEGYAIGQQNGENVQPGSPYYENNSKYYSQLAAASEQAAADYAAHIADPVSGLVSSWLDTHITQPTTPAIDTSLTVAGAAADAKSAGDPIRRMSSYFKEPVNLFDINNIQPGGYYNSSGNWIVNAGQNTSNFIKIEPGISYFTNYNGSKALAYFDANKAFISRDAAITGHEMTPLSTAAYFVFNYQSDFASDVYVSKFMLPNRFIPFNKTELCFSNLQECNMLVLGDSISATEYRWINQFKNRMKPKTLTNLAVTGAHMRDYYNTPYPYDGDPKQSDQISNVIGNQVQKYIDGFNNNIYPAADIIFIFAGTNDNWAYEAGTDIEDQFTSNGSYIPTSNVDRKLFAGAMRWIFDNLNSVVPYAPIIWITPIQCAEAIKEYTMQKDKADRIKQVAERMSCRCIDAFNQSGIYGGHEASGVPGRWLADGLHPSEKGGTFLGNYIADAYTAMWLSNYYSNTVNWNGI